MSDDEPPRPDALPVNPDPIPEKLANRCQWVAWRHQFDTARNEWTKVPVDPNIAEYANSTDEDTWTSFDDALAYHERTGTNTDGVGFVVHDRGPIVGLDLDDCRDPDTEDIEPWAEDVLDTVPTYAEVSPSGTGLRLFGLGGVPDGGTRSDIDGSEGHLEMYETGRYLTVTGHHIDGSPDNVREVNDAVGDLHAEYIADDPPKRERPEPTGDGGVEAISPGVNPTPDAADTGPSDLSDDEILERAKNAGNGNKFRRLWRGDTSGYPSHSEADLALCGFLAFWTGGDRSDIDRLFRRSGLYRDKWDEDRGNQTYGERTIDKALEGLSDFYNPSAATERFDAVEGQDSDDDVLPVPAAFDIANGGYAKWHPPRDEDGDRWYERITNFQIEVLSRLTHDDGRREFLLRIHPAEDEPYNLAVEPTSFNELRRFRRDVLEGWSVTFDGGQQELNDLKQFVAGQEAPDRQGTKQIGLHGDEFVAPEGSLTADGWTDEPEVVYTDESSQLNPLWQLSPDDDPDEIDREAVARMLELLPRTRDPERFLPVLGWFYAAPVRPLIHQWEGEFNLLNVLGDTGAGKTATLEALWQMFGMDGELLTAETTPFTMLTALSSTNGLPVVFDEYKPADMSERRKDKLHRYLRTSTKGGVESKGNADLTTDNYHLHAPVCLAGEQPIQGPAEERRAVMTTFTRDGVVGDTPQSRSFARLTGGKAADEYHDGLPLKDHALAFYQWLLERDTDSLRKLWRNSRDRVVEVLDGRDLDADVLDDMVIQGFQTVWFGCALYRMFATEMGVNTDTTAVTPSEVEDAIAYVAEEGGGADHVSHLDRFIGLLGRAAAAGYVESGEHYTVIENGIDDTRELRVRLSTAFDQVRRYARDHDVRGEDLLDSVNDYRARIRDNAEDPDGYVTTTSQPTWVNDSTQTRCVGIEIERADATVDEFEVGMFVDDSGSVAEADDGRSGVGVADLGPGHHSFEASVAAVLEPKPWLQGEGTLRDRSGKIDYVIRDGSGDVPPLKEDERYHFDGARVTTDEDGVVIVQIRPGATEVQPATKPTSLDDHDSSSDVDNDINPPTGEFEGLQANVMDTLRENDGEASLGQLAAKLANGDSSPDEVRSAVDRLESKGRVTVADDDGQIVRIL